MRPSSIPFVGRSDELGLLREELAAARSGRPRVVLLEGPPGIGKTTLVQRFLAAAPDAHVVHASGDESETDVELAMLDQLLRRAGAGGLSLAEGGHVQAGALLLEALAELQSDGTAIVVVDDAQWADGASLRALLFAMRRLVSDCVLVLIVVREGEAGNLPEGLRKLTGDAHVRLEPLAAAELREFAGAHGVPLSSRAARRLHEHSGGNPLYARELLVEVPGGLWEGSSSPLPAPKTYAELVLGRLRTLPPDAIALAEATSVLGLRGLLATAGRIAGLAEPHAAVDALLVPGLPLVELADGVAGPQLRFVHPLVRAAIYRGMSQARRAKLHLAAAEIVEDEAAALNHRVAATTGPDATLAGELAAYGARCFEAQRWSGAASAFESAARVSAERADRERHLLAAIEAAMFGGDSPRARLLARETGDFLPGPRLDAVLAYVAVGTGEREEAELRLHRAWAAYESGDDPAVAARVAERLAFLGVLRLRAADAAEWATKARAMLAPEDPVTAPAAMWLALSLHALGDRAGAYAVLDAERDRFGRGSGAIRGTLLLADGALREASDDLAAEERGVVRSGSLIVAGRLLAKHAQARFAAGDWDAAVVLADRAQAFAVESDDVSAQAVAGWAAALVPAARGELEECARLRTVLEALPVVFDAHVAERNLGLAALAAARGDHQEVLRVLEPLARIEPREAIDAPGHYPWAQLYAGALVRARRPEAREFLSRSADGRLALERGELEILAEDYTAAIAAFELAADQLPRDLVYEQALADFGHGRALRRARQRRAAAQRLAGARDVFAALRARPQLEPCERELDACGLTPSKRGPAVDRSRLTPQERAVARMAAAGRSNREIAAELLVSVKSVERYLTQVYRKLGVESRAELSAHLA